MLCINVRDLISKIVLTTALIVQKQQLLATVGTLSMFLKSYLLFTCVFLKSIQHISTVAFFPFFHF